MDLADKIIRAIKRLQPDIEKTEIEEQSEDMAEVLFFVWKNDGVIFESRPYEEDDDFPEFVGYRKIIDTVKDHVGEDFSVETWDHEKGLFSVRVSKK